MNFLPRAGRVLRSISYIALLAPLTVLAQANNNPPAPAGSKPVFSSLNDVAAKLCTVFQWLFTFALIVSFIYIVLAGIRYVTAGGNPEKVKGVHQALIWAVVGVAVALVARSVPDLIAVFLGATGKITGPAAC
jgi:hypothetical protein